MAGAHAALRVVAALGVVGCVPGDPDALWHPPPDAHGQPRPIDASPPNASIDADLGPCPQFRYDDPPPVPVEVTSPLTVGSVGFFFTTATSTDGGNICGRDQNVYGAEVFWLAVPRLSEIRLRVDQALALGLRASNCSSGDLYCGTWHESTFTDPPSDNSYDDLVVHGLPAGTYFVLTRTEAHPGGNGMALQVTGTISDGAPCDSPLVAAGVLACGAQSACRLGACAPQ